MSRGDSPVIALTSGSDSGVLGSLVSLVWLLICVVAIIVLAYLFTKYVAGRSGGMMGISGGTERFKVLERLPMGREQSVALVQAGGRYFLLGVTSSGVSLIAELTEEEAQVLHPPRPDQPAPPSFGEALRTVLKQKKPR